MGGNIIWATDFREETRTSRQGGGKGGGPKVETTEYLYYASFAVALCEGEITGIGRIWADGKPLDTSGMTWRWYPGSETQEPDPFIAATTGNDATPAYRGTAYVVSKICRSTITAIACRSSPLKCSGRWPIRTVPRG